MKVIAINGSPRRNWNTAVLLKKALEGSALSGAETELIHLADLDFNGCSSCFYCKRKNSGLPAHCALKDDLTVVLEKIAAGNVLLLGSPVYLGNITGLMKSFLERLVFSNLSYDSPEHTNFTGTLSTGFIYTMGLPHNMLETSGYQYIFNTNKSYLQLLNGPSEYMISADNYQFNDYSEYAASNFSEPHKAAVRAEQFPEDCKKAFEMGARLSLHAL